ncbi:unnamed protein product, partial [Closterium sp. NIES-54]
VEAATGLVFRFIVGHGTSEEGEQVLQAENSTHGDFLRIDVQESYLNLNRKTLVYFTSLFKLYEAEFYVKADDDIYLIPDRLSSLIARPRKSPRTYIGCMKKGAVGSNPNIKWYERKSWLLGSHYFVHAFGAIYLLSYDVVNILNAIPEDGLSMFTNEDVSVGAWMLAFDVQHEKTAYLCRKDCTPSAVAIWEPLCAVTIPLLFLLHILVLRYSCLAPAAWTAAIESDSQDELKPVAAAIDAIEPLAGLRGSMDDSEADLGGMEEAEAPRGMDEAEPRRMDERLRGMDEGLRGMDEGSRGMDEGSRGMDEPGSRGMVDAERGADRLRYPGRKRVLGFVGVFTNFASRERRGLLRETWFPATPEEHARYAIIGARAGVEAATGLVFGFIIGHGQERDGTREMGWDEMGWDGMGWDGMGWDGMGCDVMGWDGMGWDGMGWDGIGCDGMRRWGEMCWDGMKCAGMG